jgi:chorismate synthase
VRNTNQRSGDYEKLKTEDRPGHADAVWRERFKHRDHRGGGRTSGRETLCRVIGGAIAEAYLAQAFPQVSTVAWVSQVGDLVSAVPEPGLTRAMVDEHPTRCPDPVAREEMSRRILAAKEAGDSLGGCIDLRVEGLPVGLGEPIFGKLKALLAQAMGSVGAVTGSSGVRRTCSRASPCPARSSTPRRTPTRHPGRPHQRRARRPARLLQASGHARGPREGRGDMTRASCPVPSRSWRP